MTDTKRQITSHEAAAFWGSASNAFYPTQERLQLALSSLEFFGGFYERHEEMMEADSLTGFEEAVFQCSDIGVVTIFALGRESEEEAARLMDDYTGQIDLHFFIGRLAVAPLE